MGDTSEPAKDAAGPLPAPLKALLSGRWAAPLALVVLFSATRLFLFTGFPFSINFLDIGMQMLDPALLKGDLLASLVYQHTQPPLFNALVGVVLKITPSREAAALLFSWLYAGMGLFLVLGVFYLARALGTSRRLAVTAAALFVFWPPNIWEQHFNHPPPERWLSYDYPSAFLVMAMALLLARHRDTGRPLYLAIFLLTGAAVCLTRPLFHPLLWMLPLAIWALWRMRGGPVERTRLFVSVSVLALLLAVWPAARNYLLTGWFTPSTFQGMNLASRVAFVAPHDVARLVEGGKVTPLALVPRFSEPSVYMRYYGETRETGRTVLDDPVKSTGSPNFNHYIVVRASREYQRNTVALAAAYPGAVLKSLVNGLFLYFGFEPNQYLWELNNPPWGFWKVDFPPLKPAGTLWPLRYVLGPVFFAAIYFGVVLAMLRQRRDPVCLFIAFALLYIFLVSNLVEMGHNGIFRKQVDSLLFAAAATLAAGLPGRFRHRGKQAPG